MHANDLALLLRAVAFSAHRHRDQRRKGADANPYVNHPIDVANVLANVGGVRDVAVLVAAVLHDTVEDTGTRPEEIEAEFGAEVRRLVEEVTDDKTLPKAERKRRQVEHAPHLSPGAKQIKLGDKICNVADIARDPPADWSAARRAEYIDWAERVVAGCRGANAALERRFDEVAREARSGSGRGGGDA
jgi:guanosine-3',5'-bis(diphosphate) 3'-pyrophosphohydrolase